MTASGTYLDLRAKQYDTRFDARMASAVRECVQSE